MEIWIDERFFKRTFPSFIYIHIHWLCDKCKTLEKQGDTNILSLRELQYYNRVVIVEIHAKKWEHGRGSTSIAWLRMAVEAALTNEVTGGLNWKDE